MHRILLGSVASLIALTAPPVSAQVSFEMIFAGGYAITVSDDGAAVAGQLVYTYETCLWTEAGGVLPLGQSSGEVLGIIAGTPGVSADGSRVSATILGVDSTYVTQGIWSEATGWVESMPPPPPDGGLLDSAYGSAWGITGDGENVVGLYWRPGQAETGSAHASIGNATDGVVDLGSTGRSSRANKANHDGSVVVGWDEHPTGHRRPAVWRNGELTVLSDPELLGEVHAVNADGTIIAGSYKETWGRPREAWVWRWTGAEWDDGINYGSIPPTSGDQGLCRVLGISDDGSVLVGYDSFFGDPFYTTGFLWTAETGLVDIAVLLEQHGAAPPDFDILSCTDVSADGTTIVGYGRDTVEPFAFRSFRIRLDSSVDVPAVGEATSARLRAWPNPSRSETTVAFELKRPARGNLAIYDPSGRLVRTLVEGSFAEGTHRVRWDGTDRRGSRVAAGVYYSRLETDRLRATEKIVLLR